MRKQRVEETVRAWTIQPWELWTAVQAQGWMTIDPRYSANLHHCYEWLRPQLLRRIPGYQGHYPWWAYGTRPDLRQRHHHYPRSERYAMLELELSRAKTCVLTFWAWDLIFCGEFLSYTAEEAADWRRRLEAAVPNEDELPRLPQPWLSELESSWECLFAPDLPMEGWWRPHEPPVSSCEVVFEVLDLVHVKSVTAFLGTHKTMSCREIDPWLRT